MKREDIMEAADKVMKTHEVTFLKLRISELEEKLVKYYDALNLIAEDLPSYDGLVAMSYKNVAKEALK